MLHPTDYPEPVRDHMQRRLDDAAIELPEDVEWCMLTRPELKLARALWITEGSGPYAAVDAFAQVHPRAREAINDAFRSVRPCSTV